METAGKYRRPKTCEIEKTYLYYNPASSRKKNNLQKIEFLSYTAHPALVIVQKGNNNIEIARENLFCETTYHNMKKAEGN